MTRPSAWLLLALAAAACGVTTDVAPERRSQTIALVGERTDVRVPSGAPRSPAQDIRAVAKVRYTLRGGRVLYSAPR